MTEAPGVPLAQSARRILMKRFLPNFSHFDQTCMPGKVVDSLRPLTSGLSPGRGKLAVLSRSNVSVYDQAVRLTDDNPRCRLHIVGGLENFGLNRIMDIWVLMQPENNRSRGIKDSFIRRFTKQSLEGYCGLNSYAKNTKDRELEGKLSMVEKYNSRIPELVERLYRCAEREAQHADLILGTVHKSKGLEFATVVITDDFAKVPCAAHNLPRLSSCSGGDILEDEWNLLYVAVTRGQELSGHHQEHHQHPHTGWGESIDQWRLLREDVS
ncbi:hypothetical protein J4Q44_G00143890 [Coregonus suidteri]|uniref:UvrD-like helicase C-terminal domain-containing protein n=1 Tax=Coregonus suidteri TaxID=861788 RepID=A0AAN8LYI5_9TELE